MAITAQVVNVTKPLASANETVDADRWIVMRKDGGIIKRLSMEAQQEIMEIIEKQKGSAVPIGRETFVPPTSGQVSQNEILLPTGTTASFFWAWPYFTILVAKNRGPSDPPPGPPRASGPLRDPPGSHLGPIWDLFGPVCDHISTPTGPAEVQDNPLPKIPRHI